MVQNRTSHTPPGPLVVAAVVLLLALAESLVSATALQGNVRRLLGSGGTRGSDDHWESDQGDDDHRGETAGDDHLKDGISGDDARPDRPEGAAKFTVTNNAPLQCLDGKIRSATDPPTCQTFGARAAVWLSGLATAAVVGDGACDRSQAGCCSNQHAPSPATATPARRSPTCAPARSHHVC